VDQPSYYFNGLIDEAAIYNKALTVSEIQAQFNASGHYCENMVTVCCTDDDGDEYGIASNNNGVLKQERTVMIITQQ